MKKVNHFNYNYNYNYNCNCNCNCNLNSFLVQVCFGRDDRLLLCLRHLIGNSMIEELSFISACNIWDLVIFRKTENLYKNINAYISSSSSLTNMHITCNKKGVIYCKNNPYNSIDDLEMFYLVECVSQGIEWQNHENYLIYLSRFRDVKKRNWDSVIEFYEFYNQ